MAIIKYILLLALLLSSCGIVIEVQDTDDLYIQRSIGMKPRVHVRSYVPANTYYYPDIEPYYSYRYNTWFVRPVGTIIIKEAPKYDYGKRPTRGTRENIHHQQNSSTHRRGRQ